MAGWAFLAGVGTAALAMAARRWWVATRPVQATWQGWPTSFHPITPRRPR